MIQGKHTIHLIENIVKDSLTPPEDLTIAEWADKYRVLSRESSAEAGRWETDRTPYMKAIFDCVTDSITKSITIMSSAQVGKTELLLNILGRYMHLDPCPILLYNQLLMMPSHSQKKE
nr:MAG TPA: terminase large subunit [Caudoviricetes sp.]